jgi:hypothetical protein
VPSLRVDNSHRTIFVDYFGTVHEGTNRDDPEQGLNFESIILNKEPAKPKWDEIVGIIFGPSRDMEPYISGSFSLIVLGLLLKLDSIERVSVVMCFYFLLVSLFVAVAGGSFQSIAIIGIVITVMLTVKVDSCISALLSSAANASTTFWLVCALFSLFEQLTLSTIIVCTLPISLVEFLLRQCCGRCATCCCSCVATTVGIEPHSRYMAGVIEVVRGREDLEEVTLKEYIRDINESDCGYCFLKVLNRDDRVEFLRRMPKILMVDSYKRRAMRLGRWVVMMSHIQLTTNYVVYRRCYWGENVGRTNVVERKSDFIVPVWIFKKAVHSNHGSDIISGLIAMFQTLMIAAEEEVKILVDENHMEVITHPFGRYTLSRWENKEFRLETDDYVQA